MLSPSHPLLGQREKVFSRQSTGTTNKSCEVAKKKKIENRLINPYLYFPGGKRVSHMMEINFYIRNVSTLILWTFSFKKAKENILFKIIKIINFIQLISLEQFPKDIFILGERQKLPPYTQVLQPDCSMTFFLKAFILGNMANLYQLQLSYS